MRLSRLRLNRTLLLRQHLLERVRASPVDEARHLIGLQGQESLAPYLSLHARLSDLDPYDVSAALRERRLVRLLTMRGTVHLLPAEDAAPLRAWTQPRIDQELRANRSLGAARDLDRDEFAAALARILADGPRPVRELGALLAAEFDAPPTALGQLARVVAPLAQLPPRGCWKEPGGVVYQHVDAWLGTPAGALDVPALVRRYLAAFGPASAADVTAWSGVTRLGPVLSAMPDLVRHEDHDGRTLYDVAEAPVADEDAHAPVRLLGRYDNVWLSHAGRDRVTGPEERGRWMGSNGGVASIVLVDGYLQGLWQAVDDRVGTLELFRPLSRAERGELDEEIARVDRLLAA